MPPAIHATNVRFVDGCYPGLQTFSRGGRRALGGAGTAPPAPAKGGLGEVATARTPLAEMPRSTPCSRRRADLRSLSRLRPRFVWQNADNFDSDVNAWDTSSVTTMSFMFAVSARRRPNAAGRDAAEHAVLTLSR